MTKPTPTVLLVTAVIAAVVLVWLRLSPDRRRALAREAAAPYARAVSRSPIKGLRRRWKDPAPSEAGRRSPAEPPTSAEAAAPSEAGRRSPPASQALHGPARQEEAEALRAELQLLRAYQEENADLRRHLGFVERNPSLVVAEVVSFGGADAWSQRIRLGKGAGAGIVPDAPVLSTEGLVGHVVEVTETTADVLLVSDPNSHVACVVADAAGARRHGILTGSGATFPGMGAGAAPLRLDYLDRQTPPVPGAAVVTSGLGGLYPAGLAVGSVTDVSLDSGGLYLRALVEPAVPLRELRTAYVLTGWEGGP